MWKNLPFTFQLKEKIKFLENLFPDYKYSLFYFLTIILIKIFFSIILDTNKFFLKNLYHFFIFVIYFIFFYSTLLVIYLLFTKFLINRRLKKILSFYTSSFSFVVFTPFINFLFSFRKSSDFVYISFSLKDLIHIPIGIKIEIIIMGFITFLYIVSFSKKFYKIIFLTILNIFSYIFLLIFPILISGNNRDFWKGGVFPFELQKISILYGVLFVFLLFLFFLIFREYKENILRKFINYDFLFLNLFLPFMGFWTSYKIIFEEHGKFFDFPFNKFIPLFILTPVIFYSLSKFLFRKNLDYVPFTLSISLIFSLLLSFYHFFIIFILFSIYVLNRTFIKTLKIRPLEISVESAGLFLFGYTSSSGKDFLNFVDKSLFLFVFLFFLFYGTSRYFLMKRKKELGYLFFTIGIFLLPFIGFVNIFFYILLTITFVILGLFYFIGAPSLKTLDLVTYFFLAVFLVFYLIYF